MYINLNSARSLNLVPMERIPMYHIDTSSGIYSMQPTIPVPAQTRFKNMQYEPPSAHDILDPVNNPSYQQIHGNPSTLYYLNYYSHHSVQPATLTQSNLTTIENQPSVFNSLKSRLFGVLKGS